MKKRVLSAMLVAAMAMTAIPSQTFAEGALDAAQQTGNLSYDGYKKVWGDEFDGDSLNRDDWNVETHEKGWVNNELQEYVDSDENIQVKDGKLVINPVEKVETTASGGESENMIPNDAFGDASKDGVITKEVTNATMGSNPWDIQIIQNGIKIEEGETYEVSFKASSTKPRKIVAGVQKTSADYDQYGQGTFDITTESVEYKYEVNGTVTDENAGVYFNLGKSDQTPETPESTIKISDIKMVKKSISGTKVKKSYTSGRISTQNKQTFTYGRFECRAKVPKGQGYLPAFWLMANDENVYGQWPRCGEIDCMEVMGQETNKAYGTIHYGNPHSESQGTYYTGADEKDFSDAFHTFTCDWEPGKITWYVDGVKYHEESDWYSTTVGQGTLTYPAPFDQPFYIILNLAVGGSWVGNPNNETSFENNPYEIDYVRVYQKDSYDEDVKRPVKEVTLRDPDATGNYINNGDFSVKEDLSDDADWKFLTAFEGEAEASIDNNTMTVNTTNEGTVDYSVQLVQADLPFEKGATYQVQFDAYAFADRKMGVDVKAPDHGYMSYMPHQDAQLTTEKQTYTYTFKMGDASDANGRLEYNMGAKGSTADIYISNVSVKKIKEADPNEKEEKTVLANGNYVYNGSFQEGDKHLGYWNISNAENADVTVTPFSDGRRLKVTMSGNEKSAVVISQEELAFATGTPYKFSFTASSDADNTLTANIGGHVYTFDIKAGETKDFAVELPSDAQYVNHDISITLGMQGTTWLDKVSLVENALVKNGSFNDGTTGYTIYVDSSAKASYVVDSLKDNNALAVTINDTGDQDWKVQIKQENIKLEKGKTYKLKFKAKSSLNRQIRVVMQGQENRGWSVYSSDNIVNLTNEYQTFEDTFTMNEDTDTAAFFSACLGKIGDNQITTQHEVRIDDISLEEVKDDPKEDIKDNPKDDPKEDIKDNPKDDPKGDIKDNPKDDPKQDINTDIKNEQPKVPAPVIKTSDSDKAKTTQAVKESKTAKAAKTGDNSPIMAYVFGAMAGALILAVSFLKKRKKTNN